MRAGRPKTFDEREVLGRAMEVFWQEGYDGAGLSRLLEHMGISRQSLYDTFGSKRDLFLRTIDHYKETQLSHALALLGRAGSPLENVKALVGFFEELALDQRCRGCLVANALVEVAPRDEEIAAVLQQTLELLQGAIADSLREAQTRGELSPDKSPVELSRALMNALVGLAVCGKLPMSPEAIHDIYAGTLRILD